MSEMIDKNQLEEILGARGYTDPQGTVSNWVRREKIECTRRDGKKFFYKNEIKKYLEELENKSGRRPGTSVPRKNGFVRHIPTAPPASKREKDSEIINGLPPHVLHYLAIYARSKDLTIYEIASEVISSSVEQVIQDSFSNLFDH